MRMSPLTRLFVEAYGVLTLRHKKGLISKHGHNTARFGAEVAR
jgi:hypothetical protein